MAAAFLSCLVWVQEVAFPGCCCAGGWCCTIPWAGVVLPFLFGDTPASSLLHLFHSSGTHTASPRAPSSQLLLARGQG